VISKILLSPSFVRAVSTLVDCKFGTIFIAKFDPSVSRAIFSNYSALANEWRVEVDFHWLVLGVVMRRGSCTA